MISVNVDELRKHLSRCISAVEGGEEIEIRKGQMVVARIIPIEHSRANRTKLDCGADTVKVLGDLAEPVISGDEHA